MEKGLFSSRQPLREPQGPGYLGMLTSLGGWTEVGVVGDPAPLIRGVEWGKAGSSWGLHGAPAGARWTLASLDSALEFWPQAVA